MLAKSKTKKSAIIQYSKKNPLLSCYNVKNLQYCSYVWWGY